MSPTTTPASLPPALPPSEDPDGWFRDILKRRLSHEQLALLFVLAIYISGILLTSLLIVRVLSWGLLASFGHIRMMGLLISFASLGLLASRVLAGRYGNRLAARWLPRTLSAALPIRLIMRSFGLRSSKELQAFVLLHKLHVYSAQTGQPLNSVETPPEAVLDLPCVLEPLFTHDMYLPMMRTWLIRSDRLWFDAEEIGALVETEKKRYRELILPRT